MSEVLPTLPSPPTTILRVGRLAPLAWPTALATPAPRHHPAGTRPAPPREQRYCPPPWVSTGRGPWGVGRRAWAEGRGPRSEERERQRSSFGHCRLARGNLTAWT